MKQYQFLTAFGTGGEWNLQSFQGIFLSTACVAPGSDASLHFWWFHVFIARGQVLTGNSSYSLPSRTNMKETDQTICRLQTTYLIRYRMHLNATHYILHTLYKTRYMGHRYTIYIHYFNISLHTNLHIQCYMICQDQVVRSSG